MIHFLCSLPRSGSTLLASLLSQRDDTYVSPTSNLGELIASVTRDFNKTKETSNSDAEELFSCLNGLMYGKYKLHKEPVLIDKAREWVHPEALELLTSTLGQPPKIIMTVRPMVECLASLYSISKAVNFSEWFHHSIICESLKESYASFKAGYERYPEYFCLVDYSNLCSQTQVELDRIADFLEIPHVNFNPKIEQVKENDKAWGIKDLHMLEPTIQNDNIDTKKILGEKMFNAFNCGSFWNDEPEPVKEQQPLDLSLEAGLRGEFSKAWDILQEAQRLDPSDNRAAFNLGWYEMRHGNLLKGHKMMERGRIERAFGNDPVSTPQPSWRGERNSTVLLNLEGGLGDQIHTVRYAKDIASRNNTVVISGSTELVDLVKEVEGVACFTSDYRTVYHDYWVQSMSAPIALNLEWSDICGKPYIKQIGESRGKVGVAWSGNPTFEHEQHRLFPKELMFEAVKLMDCISLQKEGDAPEWMEQPLLENWTDTQLAISQCDLVISSCTSVAHLAGAMGIETWIVVPILPYYLWTYQGDKTPHYNSVTLFRQEKFGEWESPFNAITQKLMERRNNPVEIYDSLSESTLQFIENS